MPARQKDMIRLILKALVAEQATRIAELGTPNIAVP